MEEYYIAEAAKDMLEQIAQQVPGTTVGYRMPVGSKKDGEALVDAVSAACLSVVDTRVERELSPDGFVALVYAQVLVMT